MQRRERFSEERRRDIFERTRGRCHLCHKRLCYKNYGLYGARGAWHVDHSVPIARGGTNHGNNLRVACIGCNLDKSTVSSRTARSWNGKTRGPMSRARFEEARRANAASGGALGATIGGVIGAPPGALIGVVLGVALGHDSNPEE